MDINVSAFRMQETMQATSRSNMEDMEAKHYEYQGYIEVAHTGSLVATIDFPVKYTKPPFPYFGAFLKDGQNVDIDILPEWDVTVLKWQVDSRPPVNLYYIGATLGIKTYGPEDQILVITYGFNGMALSSPSGTDWGLDTPI